jgi:hypothetical protein
LFARKEPILADDKDWRRFPQFEKIFDSGQMPATLEKVQNTCKQLDNVIQTGTAEEKARAQIAMTAFGRALEVLKQLAEMRENSIKK